LQIASRNSSGRVDRLTLDGMTPGQISGQDLRMVVGPTLGWLRILSTSFELRRTGASYRFTGRGSGHGVGMCVIGAMHRAEAGENATSILERYYPGLRIANYASPAATTTAAATEAPPRASTPAAAPAPRPAGVLVTLASSSVGELSAIETLVAEARDDLARALEVPAPARLALTFHPTADDYERAAGAPWFTSTAVVEGEMHFLPAEVLRNRGALERTIRRALARVMTAAALEGRRAWVREGAAIYFSEPSDSHPVPAQRATCPTDAELMSPTSAGALSEAYARARACFASRLEDGRRWQEIR
jgi:hypothetical protein